VLALETHLRVKLLNRTTRSMSLTDEGRQCHEQALKLIGDMADLEDSLRNTARVPDGKLRVDMPGILLRQIVAPALPEFIAAYPGIELVITASDRLIDMVEEGIDVLVRIGKLQNSGLIAKILAPTQFITCASPEFIKDHGVPATPKELADFSCLKFLYPKTRQVRPWLFQQDGDEFSWAPDGPLAMDHVDSLIEAGINGAGIIQHLSVSLREPLAAGKLVALFQQWQALGPDISVLVQQRHYRTAKIKVFVEFLEKLFASSAKVA
jgi:LysR family transcriptional regulator for bpeEF and oprC